MGGTNHGDILPGGKCAWHRFDPSKSEHFSQKLLYRMVNDRNPAIPIMENKYLARELVQRLGGCALPEIYHWSTDSKVRIAWENLPKRCVIKTNHWSGDTLFIMDNADKPLNGITRKLKLRSRGENGYLVIRNGKDQHGKPWPKWRIQWTLSRNLKKDFPVPLEWGAYNIKPRGVMIEELLVDETDSLPSDWKFHCFSGKVGIIQLDTGRMSQHSQAIYDCDGNKIEQTNAHKIDLGEPQNLATILKPEILKSMISICENLSKEIDYTRVDLFLCGQEIYFGEYTNYHQSASPQSIEWDTLAGRLWAQQITDGVEQ
ncbi:MAG: ATP-grasp fold amidoligase family protein [archaeon]|nr:ATP-grasp fold amidoligase family protein [archaeon]MDA1130731.1 ATP-grasp fold amidoligase family protein [archaeon]